MKRQFFQQQRGGGQKHAEPNREQEKNQGALEGKQAQEISDEDEDVTGNLDKRFYPLEEQHEGKCQPAGKPASPLKEKTAIEPQTVAQATLPSHALVAKCLEVF